MVMLLFAGIVDPDKVIDGAKRLSSLDSCSIWALLCIVLAMLLAYMIRQYSNDRNKAIEARMEASKADMEVANAIEKLAEQLQELRHSLEKGGSNVRPTV